MNLNLIEIHATVKSIKTLIVFYDISLGQLDTMEEKTGHLKGIGVNDVDVESKVG